ncbi:6-phosphogluconate dehydrogenase, decarboxylating [Agromyces marinus]|uniref:6-phosphogluconate dehydrogenase, decarboxylating n=2 Tax=Agromyces marinus TaxID=1389020 RepID=A0ABM8H4V7_9MICO|nr:6-phosphogluconate dehydrogenase, decarboxylating [Agromyces marinus]
MVQAGKGTDAVISELVSRFEPGDIIVDGGNANFHDTIRREAEIKPTGIHFVGAGISGGEEGALNGPSIMPGGSVESYETLGPILASIAAVAEGEPCVTHIGTDGAGHFVKMVHNGIEYADMQLIAEAYDLIRRGTGKSPSEIADVFAEWNTGDLESYLIEITAEVLRQTDAATGQPLVDVILDEAGAKGTGAWTVQNALDLGVPVSGIAEAVFARSLSSKRAQREAAADLPGPDEAWTVAPEDTDAFIEDVRQALYASKIIAYSQGFDEIIAGAEQYGWNVHKGEVAKIWRAGCIIRARFLNRIAEAYADDPSLVALAVAPYFRDAIAGGQSAWRRVVATAAQAGIPTPAFSSSLAYYDGLRADRLPAALVQGQRDFFGAHTYRRVDRDGVFHTLWSGDRSEIETTPSSH